MRKVIVATQQASKPVKIENFEGATWGELKVHPDVAPLLGENVEAILKQGNVTLSREDASLGEGDIIVYLVPTKNKAGMGAEAAEKLADSIVEAIAKAQAIAESRDIEELKGELITTIANFFEVKESDIADDSDNNDNNDEENSELSPEDEAIMDDFDSYL